MAKRSPPSKRRGRPARRRRWGRVRQLPSGQWQARAPDPMRPGHLVSAPKTFTSRTDAERWLAAQETDQARGVWVDPSLGQVTFADWVFQWRENINDGVYNIPGFLIAAANGNRERYVGDRPGMEVHWQATRHLWFQADYGIFIAGPFLKAAGPGKNLSYSAMYAGYRF